MIWKCTSMQHYQKPRKNDTEQKIEYLISLQQKKWMDEKQKIPTNKLTKPLSI